MSDTKACVNLWDVIHTVNWSQRDRTGSGVHVYTVCGLTGRVNVSQLTTGQPTCKDCEASR